MAGSSLVRLLCVLVLAGGASLQARGQAPEAAPDAAADQPASTPSELTPLAEVEVAGAPVPIVLIPPLACEAWIWRPYMERNADKYVMYAVTLPGYAGSQPPPVPAEGDFNSVPWVKNAAAAVLHLIEQRGLDRPVLVGLGYGGSIALRTGILDPDAVRGVVTIDGYAAQPLQGPRDSGIVDRELRYRYVERFKGDGFGEELWQVMVDAASAMFTSDGERAKELAEHMGDAPIHVARRYFIEALADDFRRDLPKLTAPVLALAPVAPGRADPEATIRGMWEANLGACPDLTIKLLEDSGTFPMDDVPQAFDAAIDAFIQGLDETGAAGDPASLEPADAEGADGGGE